MEKTMNWMLAAIFICGLSAMMACSSHDLPVTPEPPVTDDVRLTNITQLYNNSLISKATADYTWEDGLLKQMHAVSEMGIFGKTETFENYIYDGGDCVEYNNSKNKHQYFTYANGRMTSAVEMDGDFMTMRVNINGYTDDGHISKMKLEGFHTDGSQDVIEYTLTWKDGDLVSALVHQVESAAEDEVFTFDYDDYPSAYTGIPLAQCIFSVSSIAMRNSRHNCISEDEQYEYDNGRMVSKVNKSGNITYYTYSDGTGSR